MMPAADAWDDAADGMGQSVRRGRFISFEGGEGTGKSTQARLLGKRLGQKGLDVVLTREPGGSPAAELIRRLLLLGVAEPFGPECETALFYAARGDHLDRVILPALTRGAWVISDRFSDSTRAYQDLAYRLPTSDVDTDVPSEAFHRAHGLIERLERGVVGQNAPDLTLILDLDPEISIQRARGETAKSATGAGADVFEDRDIAFHRAVREAFRNIADADPDRCVVIDASAPRRSVQAAIWKEVRTRFATDLKAVAADAAAGAGTAS